ncbi:hypothetical protein EXS45_01750 [Candidatus Nomurabacteria bacterium]|nr:hypothetical protein [Candidatus Nomurabacteria bacterium]
MRQISSKLNMYVKSVSVINNNIERLMLHIIIFSFSAIVFCYVLFLGNMVRNIVVRQSLETNARALTNEVRNLEVVYLSMSSDVDLAFSYSIGFKEVKANFTTRKALGLNSNESFGNLKIVKNDI